MSRARWGNNWKLFFLISDGSFEHPKQMLKLMNKKIITILRFLFVLFDLILYVSSTVYQL